MRFHQGPQSLAVAPTLAGVRLSGEVWADLDFAAEPLAALAEPERVQLRDLLRKINPGTG